MKNLESAECILQRGAKIAVLVLYLHEGNLVLWITVYVQIILRIDSSFPGFSRMIKPHLDRGKFFTFLLFYFIIWGGVVLPTILGNDKKLPETREFRRKILEEI